MIAMNEEVESAPHLESVRWADEIIVVDSGIEGPHARDCQILWRPRPVTPPSAAMRAEKRGLALHSSGFCCSTPTRFSRPIAGRDPPGAQREPKYNAYWIPRLNLIFGRWMRHGASIPTASYASSNAAPPGSARASARIDAPVHGPRGNSSTICSTTPNPDIGKYSISNILNRYSSEIAQLLHNKGRDSQSLPAFIWNAVLNPAATFIYNYFFRLGFLDGARAYCCT